MKKERLYLPIAGQRIRTLVAGTYHFDCIDIAAGAAFGQGNMFDFCHIDDDAQTG